jgi:hypothetical protein
MPETSFDKIAGAGMDRVERPGSTEWVTLTATHNVRHEGKFDPLPVVPPPMPSAADLPPPPVREPPTEAQLRQRLLDTRDARTAAVAAREVAQQAHLRGRQAVSDAQRRAAQFVGLEQQIAERVTNELRQGDWSDVAAFEGALRDRTLADAALSAATVAETRLLQEHDQATTRWQESDRAVKSALADLVPLGFEKLRQRRAGLAAELVIVENTIAYTVVTEETALGKAILADPINADLTVEANPEAKAPPPTPPPVVTMPEDRIRVQRPVGDDGPEVVLTMQEFHQWRRAEMEQQPLAVREDAARTAAYRKVGT